jgi:hypothetical protein
MPYAPKWKQQERGRERERLANGIREYYHYLFWNQLHLANTLFERNTENLIPGGIYGR